MARKRTAFSREELGLLAGIHADPKPDDRRLVYADWLEEAGQAKYAKFIRLQLQHGSWQPTISQRSPREQELERQYGWEWAKAQRCGLEPFRYYRGLPFPVLYLSRCSTERLTRLLEQMNPRYRVMLMLEQRKLLHPGESEVIFRHPFMGRVAVLRLIFDERGGTWESFLHRLAGLPLPHTAERLSLHWSGDEARGLANALFGERYIVEE